MRSNLAQSAFVQGEISKKMRGRYDLEQYFMACERMENFIPQTQGGVMFRNGLIQASGTKSNNEATLIPFQFNDEQAYILEFTQFRIRFYANEGLLTEAGKAITNITQANPAVVTVASHGYTTGQSVLLRGISGMTQLNEVTAVVGATATNTFELTGIDSTGFDAYVSGGFSARIVELTSPYNISQAKQLQYVQNADSMYIAQKDHPPRQLTRTSATSFSIIAIAFQRAPLGAANPFVINPNYTLTPSSTTGTITITANFSAFVATDVGRVVAMVHGSVFGFAVITVYTSATQVTANVAEEFGAASATNNWRLGGFSVTTGYPSAVALYEGRLWFGGTPSLPQTMWGSSSGDFLDFMPPANLTFTADSPLQFTIGSQDVNLIRFIVGMQEQMLIGTFGGNFIVKGALDTALTPLSPPSVRPADGVGSENQVPILRNDQVVFVERGARTLRAMDYKFNNDAYTSDDLNLLSEDITRGEIKQIAFQVGRPEIIWCAKNNGQLIGLTYKPQQMVLAWHRHPLREGDEVVSVATISRPGDFDQLWVVTKRIINGQTKYFVEFLEDSIEFSEPLDSYTGNMSTDEMRHIAILNEQQKYSIHLDCAITYNGLNDGLNATATITPSATTGSITILSDNAVFDSGMINREIWRKTINGSQFGRARITAFTSSTEVDALVLQDFDSTTAIPYNEWYLTTSQLTGINHLEGETVGIVTDGAIHPNKTVSSGKITLDYQASVVHIGLGYTGILKTINFDMPAQMGSMGKYKNMYRCGFKFADTLGIKFGTSPYLLSQILFRNTNSLMNNPPVVFTGTKDLFYPDNDKVEKHIYIFQDFALPATIEQIIPFMEVRDS